MLKFVAGHGTVV